jgi:hypothetical protein
MAHIAAASEPTLERVPCGGTRFFAAKVRGINRTRRLGQRPLWVNLVILTMRRSFPVYPY